MIVPAEAVLIAAGLHVPVMPFVEVPGNAPGAAPTQYGPKAANAGVTMAVPTTLPLI